MMSVLNAAPMDRRQWLRRAGATGLGAAAAVVPAPLRAAPVHPRPRNPEHALHRLLEGNERFVRGVPEGPNRSIARLRELQAGQTPFASVLACSDSRVPPEILFDQGLGDLFVSRVAGNIATSEMIGSLEFASAALGAQLVVVLGHTKCGAVSATVAGDPVPGQIGGLFPYIHPAAEEVAEETGGHAPPPIPEVIAQNVRHQVNILREASPVLRDLGREGKVQVVGGVFHFDTGRVEMLDVDHYAP